MKVDTREGAADCLAICGVVLFSALPYMFRLGFYGDDWWYQAALAQCNDQGIAAMFRGLYKADPGMLVRPVQMAYLVFSFKAFGRYALPYHVISSFVLGFVAACLYLVLRELRASRYLAFVIALVFGLLPHYSTDRFWISAQQATLSLGFAFLGIYALLRSLRPDGRHAKVWVAVNITAFVLSLLSYEVTLGLIMAGLGYAGFRRYKDSRANCQPAIRSLGSVIISTTVLLLVGIVKAGQQSRIVYHHHFFLFFGQRVWRTIIQSIRFNLWTYCVKMPFVLVSLHRHSALTWTAIGMAISIAVFATGYLWFRISPAEVPSRRECLWLAILGFVVFGLGFLLFASAGEIDFSAPGLDNRVAIASAVGAGCVLVALAGFASSLLPTRKLRAGVFSVAIGVICGANALAVNGMGYFWADGALRQSSILKSVSTNVRGLPRGSLLMLNGFCEYSGPGSVFYMYWDASGAIRLTLSDYSLDSIVVSRESPMLGSANGIAIPGKAGGEFPYGSHLFIYDVQDQTLTNLPSKMAESAYFREKNVSGQIACPAVRDENGASVF